MLRASPIYRKKESPLIYIVTAGLVAGALISGWKAAAPQIEACSRLEKAALIAGRVVTDNATYELGDLTTNVISYRLPIYFDNTNNTLYGFGNCP